MHAFRICYASKDYFYSSAVPAYYFIIFVLVVDGSVADTAADGIVVISHLMVAPLEICSEHWREHIP